MCDYMTRPTDQSKIVTHVSDKKLTTVIPVLLTRSKDDRERHISEKVECLVLLGEELPLPSLPAEPYELKSKTLKKVAIPVSLSLQPL